MFERVKFSRIDIDKTYVRVLECGFGSGGEIGVTRSYTDDQVCVTGDAVCGQRAGRAHRAQVLGMVIGQGTLSRLRFSYRNTCLTDELSQCLSCFTVKHTTAGDDQGPLAAPYCFHRLREQELVRLQTRDVPDAVRK